MQEKWGKYNFIPVIHCAGMVCLIASVLVPPSRLGVPVVHTHYHEHGRQARLALRASVTQSVIRIGYSVIHSVSQSVSQ